MKRRMPLILGLLVALVLALGCALAGTYLYVRSSLANVYVTLDKMSVSSKSPSGGMNPLDLLVRGLTTEVLVDSLLSIENRNAISATVESIDYRIRVNGKDVGAGHGPEGGAKNIASHSKSVLVTRTKMPVTSLLAAGADSFVKGNAAIDIVGTARIRVLFLTIERDFQFTPATIEGERLDKMLVRP